MNQRDKHFWIGRLSKLYDEAKARHGGASLTIYGDVSNLLDYLEDMEEVPEGMNLAVECDNLAGRLRQI